MAELMSGLDGPILLVDADAARRSLIEQALAEDGRPFECLAASSAARAVDLIAARRPGLVISSRSLPDADALELVQRIHRIDADLPVWILSTSGGDDGDEGSHPAKEAMRAGAADYLTLGPATLARLPFLAARTLEGRRSRQRPLETAPCEHSHDLSSIAHDLRSPLAGLTALVELMGSGADGPLTAAQQGRIERIRAALERLAGIAGDVADLARMEAGRLTLRRAPCDLAGVTHAAKSALEPALRSRSLGLQILLPPDLPPIQGDPDRMLQIIVSLAAGMLRQAEGTALELAATVRGAMVEVTLREGSRGIPVEALPADFARLGEDASAAPAGRPDAFQGVPLSLARGLVLLHGGSLRIGRDADGALFASFTVPTSTPDALPRAERPFEDLHPTS